MKLYYTRTWEANIDEETIKNECEPYLNLFFPLYSRKQKNHIIDIIMCHIIDKYTEYNSLQVPNAFVKPLKEKIKQYLEFYPLLVENIIKGESEK